MALSTMMLLLLADYHESRVAITLISNNDTMIQWNTSSERAGLQSYAMLWLGWGGEVGIRIITSIRIRTSKA